MHSAVARLLPIISKPYLTKPEIYFLACFEPITSSSHYHSTIKAWTLILNNLCLKNVSKVNSWRTRIALNSCKPHSTVQWLCDPNQMFLIGWFDVIRWADLNCSFVFISDHPPITLFVGFNPVTCKPHIRMYVDICENDIINAFVQSSFKVSFNDWCLTWLNLSHKLSNNSCQQYSRSMSQLEHTRFTITICKTLIEHTWYCQLLSD